MRRQGIVCIVIVARITGLMMQVIVVVVVGIVSGVGGIATTGIDRWAMREDSSHAIGKAVQREIVRIPNG